jgi:DNA-binding MarR family transcriptional regulator
MSSRESADEGDKRVGYLLKRAQHALRVRMDAALRPLGLTTPQYAVLCAVEREPGISNAALARAAFVTAQSMQGIVANLERDGLIAREADPDHGRILRSLLTAKGRTVLARAHTAANAVDSAMTAGMSATETARLAALLARCAGNLAESGGEER